ncbi:MAG: cell division protein ZapA [Clostridiales Family XIII bacterium]|nr:cell division protein ZapA [Clostridiales Family XIII bacterium]
MTESEFSKVTIKIYGQDYTFASAKSKDRIVSVANHVDEVIRGLVEQGADGSVARLSMLAAINIAEELSHERDLEVEIEREKEQLCKDIAHFQQLWEEAKRSHLQYKDDAKAVQEQKDALQEKLNAKIIENDNLVRSAEERERVVRRLESELEKANEKLRNVSDQSEDSSELIRDLKDKLKEIEGNYFELQMENIQMKGDLEHYRNNP